MRAHCENGAIIARFLKNHQKVEKVYWPGFEEHPNYDIAKIQMRSFGGMMSFVLKEGTQAAVNKMMTSTKLFALAESLGGVESLINHPASMTHASIPKENRDRIGIVEGLIRLSVGIEDIDDLLEDLKIALDKV